MLQFNASLKQGCLPHDWKTASVTKKGDHSNPTNYRPTSLTSVYMQLTKKEMIFNNAFEESNHDNNEYQQTEVHNGDADDAVNVKQPSRASRNFAKPVSYKDITEAMQKAVQSTWFSPLKAQRDNTVKHCATRQLILKYCANVFHCLRAWVLSA